jgi:hypothetical protein
MRNHFGIQQLLKLDDFYKKDFVEIPKIQVF